MNRLKNWLSPNRATGDRNSQPNNPKLIITPAPDTNNNCSSPWSDGLDSPGGGSQNLSPRSRFAKFKDLIDRISKSPLSPGSWSKASNRDTSAEESNCFANDAWYEDLKILESNLSTYKCPFDDYLMLTAIKELNENPITRNQKVTNLFIDFCKKLQKKDPRMAQLAKHRENLINPVFLLRFLRVAKFNGKKALKRLSTWMDLIDGKDWPELPAIINNYEKIRDLAKANSNFLLKNGMALTENQAQIWEIQKQNQSKKSSKARKPPRTAYLITYENGGHLASYAKFNDYCLDMIALTICALDHLCLSDESVHVLGTFSANIITDQKKCDVSTWWVLKHTKLMIKMLKVLTSGVGIRARGMLKLNVKCSKYVKFFENLVDPFLTEKIKNRRKSYGAGWAEEKIFNQEGIPEKYGGMLDNEAGLAWVEEYFGVHKEE